MKLAIVGVTGLVGGVMLKVLDELDFPFSELIPVASEKSVGKSITYRDKSYKVVSMQEAIGMKPDIAIFSAGGSTSLQWAPEFAAVGCTVIDNSSAWRMHPDKKLIVPEINAGLLTPEDKIIANPNCSTIQMVMALAPLHERYRIKRLVISTYQSFTGTGAKAVAQYEAERDGKVLDKEEMAYHYRIFENCIPQCDVFLDNHYTKEEMKLVNETRKILGDESIRITATAVRVPVNGGHSESVNVEFHYPFNLSDVIDILNNTRGVVVQDDPATFSYPMPLYAKNKNEVFVGRIRKDESQSNSLNMWIVADNLRKGAATNAIQIAQYLLDNKLV
jgi:aspartate-semialdehyde dehydrogenase